MRLSNNAAFNSMENTEDKWIARHDEVHAAFHTESILTASRPILERHLLTLCNVKMLSEDNQTRNNNRAEMIKHLLAVRIGEELQRRSHKISIAALVISLVALVVTVLRH